MKHSWLLIILLLVNCTSKEKIRPSVGTDDESQYIMLSADNIQEESDKIEWLPDPLILDGRPYVKEVRGYRKVYRKDEAHLITSIYCDFSPEADERWYSFEGMEQLENLRSLSINGEGDFLFKIDFAPLASLSNLEYLSSRNGVLCGNNFKGFEHLANLKTINIVESVDILAGVDFTLLASLSNLEEIYFSDIEDEGGILATVDLTPFASLPKLQKIYFDGAITRLPDLTKLTNLRTISITGAQLRNLEGIGAPNLRKIGIRNGTAINSLAPLNNLLYLEDLEIYLPRETEYKIADMANLPALRRLVFYIGRIDLRGIENMSSLKLLWVSECEPFNIEGIGKLENIEELLINIVSPEPSLEFLRDMPNLSDLALYADNWRFSLYEFEAYQILDVSPLATLKNLRKFSCCGFIIKNISALDILALPDGPSFGTDANGRYSILLIKSRLYDKTEKSRHNLVFEIYE